jgi:hypothetical protein
VARNDKLPLSRFVSAPGRVLMGLSIYDFGDIHLSYEMTPRRARQIAVELLATADNAELMAHTFPLLTPQDDTKAIDVEVQEQEA